jgi:hypothetical protein
MQPTPRTEAAVHVQEARSRIRAAHAAAERGIVGDVDPVEVLFGICGLVEQADRHLHALGVEP